MSARAQVTTAALVVRLVDFGEADRIVGLLTRTHGLVSAVARGARKSRKRFGGVLQTGHALEVDFVPGASSLARLDAARLIAPHLGIVGDLERLDEASRVIRVVRDSVADSVPDPELFDAVLAHLGALDRGGADSARLAGFRLDLFDRLGVAPELERCVVCAKPAPAERPAYFDPGRGGLVCRGCGGAHMILSTEARSLARKRRAGDSVEGADRAVANELNRALDAFEARHLAHRREG